MWIFKGHTGGEETDKDRRKVNLWDVRTLKAMGSLVSPPSPQSPAVSKELYGAFVEPLGPDLTPESLYLNRWCFHTQPVGADSLSPPVNVTIKAVKANSAVVTWDIPEGDPVIGFAITQQKKDVRMLRFIQEVNTTTRSCALWDLEGETDYIVHVQSISMSGTSPLSETLRFRTPKEAETQASKSKDEVTMEEVGQSTQLRAGELIIIVVVLIMWAGVIALFCRQYDIIKDNEPNNNKDKAKNSSECSTPEHPTGGLLRSKFPKNNNNNNRMPSVNIIEV
ncbi:fibronectin type III domain-containing protein 5 [Cyclopterus lumpus]|uniref:fibronectin type III domain-containing protein 5 n=1 Tax=Cyclopterus lumpus TaxID=8103 RepID=UPI0014873181|nr:fibronectin type III domain-containing protein 5 [Cyclopterus lumpus]